MNLKKHLKPGLIMGLEGKLGAGKTTLVKGIAKSLLIEEEITSPSFTLIAEHMGILHGKSLKLFHIDLYRINSLSETEDMGLEEILYSDNISIIEWSEKAKMILPEKYILIRILIKKDTHREIYIEGADL